MVIDMWLYYLYRLFLSLLQFVRVICFSFLFDLDQCNMYYCDFVISFIISLCDVVSYLLPLLFIQMSNTESDSSSDDGDQFFFI